MTWKDFATSRPEEATAYLSYVMGLMTEIASYLGKTEDIPLYEEYRDGAKRTYQKTCTPAKVFFGYGSSGETGKAPLFWIDG